MILSQPDLRKAVDAGEVGFDPPLEERQWGEASVDLRLGLKFTKLLPAEGATFSLAQGLATIVKAGIWAEEILPEKDKFGKRRTFVSQHRRIPRSDFGVTKFIAQPASPRSSSASASSRPPA